MPSVAALFVRSDSCYRDIPGVDVYDAQRDALTWCGGVPVVAHPPCRSWGRLSAFAKPRPGEKELALWAVAQVRRFGGVLEHPFGSQLVHAANLPSPGEVDSFGGFLFYANQFHFGHRALKPSIFYVVGCAPSDLPLFPFRDGLPLTTVENMDVSEREKTPPELARWLVDLASICTSPLTCDTCSRLDSCFSAGRSLCLGGVC